MFRAIHAFLPKRLQEPFYDFCKRLNNHLLGGNRTRMSGRDNQVQRHRCILKRTRIAIAGDGNRIWIAPGARVLDAVIAITGDGNALSIGRDCKIVGRLELIGNGCAIQIGDGTSMIGAHLGAYEQDTAIRIGTDCMMGAGTDIRTGDSHAVVDLAGKRLNLARDVAIGDHVWLGRGVQVLKGVAIGSHAVVGANALVSRSLPGHCIAVGIPAAVVRQGVSWVRHLADLQAAPAPRQQQPWPGVEGSESQRIRAAWAWARRAWNAPEAGQGPAGRT
jgi:acetyltransferase-like isoleucine patch superfamily enzyme